MMRAGCSPESDCAGSNHFRRAPFSLLAACNFLAVLPSVGITLDFKWSFEEVSIMGAM